VSGSVSRPRGKDEAAPDAVSPPDTVSPVSPRLEILFLQLVTHARRRGERGIIVAGGLMASGALGGVIGAALRVLPHSKEEWIQTPYYARDAVSQSVSALLFVGLRLYVWFGSLSPKGAN
jgi:hypothetical protein